MVATGNPASAQRLHARGLVNEVAEPGDALRAASARATALADGPAFALGRIKSLLSAGERESLSHQLVRERGNFRRHPVSR